MRPTECVPRIPLERQPRALGLVPATWRAALRDRGEAQHGHRRTSLVLVTSTQVQPVSLQTRSSPAARRTVVVVARDELALVDPQFTVEKMQLFDARMGVRRVTRAGRQAHQHADPMPFARRSPAACIRSRARPVPNPARTTAAPAAAPAAAPSPRRCAAQDAPAAMSSDAARRSARRRTDRPPGGGSPVRAGSAGTRRCAPGLRAVRSPAGPAGRRRTPARPLSHGDGKCACIPPKTTTASFWIGPQGSAMPVRHTPFSEGYPWCW